MDSGQNQIDAEVIHEKKCLSSCFEKTELEYMDMISVDNKHKPKFPRWFVLTTCCCIHVGWLGIFIYAFYQGMAANGCRVCS